MIDSGTCPSGFAEDATLDGKTLFGTLAAHGDVGTTGGSDSITPAGSISASFTGTPGIVPAETISGSDAAVSAGTPNGSVSWPANPPTFAGNAGTVPAETISWPAGVPTFAGTALGTHSHELPFIKAAGGTAALFMLASSVFGTGTSRAPESTITPTASTTSAAVLKSQAITAGTPAGTVAWPAGVPTNGTVSFTPAGTVSWPASVPTFAGTALGTHSHGVGTLTNGTVNFTPAGSVNASFTGTGFDNRSAFTRVIFCKKA